MIKPRTVKHFSLHRIAHTELRVVSDVEAGVIPLIRAEEQVLVKYVQSPQWRQQVVTLFVLRDLEPLIGQLSQKSALPPGGLSGLQYRPTLNVYDLANPIACHIFINQGAMEKEDYWDDYEAIKALLAHEHGHPLAECETTRAARHIEITVHTRDTVNLFRRGAPREKIREWQDKIERLVNVVVEKLCVYGPREVFANDVALQTGFADALFYLDAENVRKAAASIEARQTLLERLHGEMETGQVLTEHAVGLLMAMADIKGYLDLAMEMASFYRQGKQSEAEKLEGLFMRDVITHLEPEVGEAYQALRENYVGFPTDLTPQQLTLREKQLLPILDRALRVKGLALDYRVEVSPTHWG
jgi:hypothetical protein